MKKSLCFKLEASSTFAAEIKNNRIMTNLDRNIDTENKPKQVLVKFANTKRVQWSKARRYAL